MNIHTLRDTQRALIAIFVLVGTSACATMDQSYTQPPDTQELATADPVRATSTLTNATSESAKAAYLSGDLEAAERHYKVLVHQRPGDAKVFYNLSMVQLALAHDGLQNYLRIEQDPNRRLRAQQLLQRLSALASM